MMDFREETIWVGVGANRRMIPVNTQEKWDAVVAAVKAACAYRGLKEDPDPKQDQMKDFLQDAEQRARNGRTFGDIQRELEKDLDWRFPDTRHRVL